MNRNCLCACLASHCDTLNPDESVKPPDDCKTIFVKNIAFDAKEDEVGEFFAQCGKVVNVRFVYNPHQKHFKG